MAVAKKSHSLVGEHRRSPIPPLQPPPPPSSSYADLTESCLAIAARWSPFIRSRSSLESEWMVTLCHILHSFLGPPPQTSHPSSIVVVDDPLLVLHLLGDHNLVRRVMDFCTVRNRRARLHFWTTTTTTTTRAVCTKWGRINVVFLRGPQTEN